MVDMWPYEFVLVPVVINSMMVFISFQVIAFFSTKLEKSGPSPYSSGFVLETIIQASKSWPRNRLRVYNVYVHVHVLMKDWYAEFQCSVLSVTLTVISWCCIVSPKARHQGAPPPILANFPLMWSLKWIKFFDVAIVFKLSSLLSCLFWGKTLVFGQCWLLMKTRRGGIIISAEPISAALCNDIAVTSVVIIILCWMKISPYPFVWEPHVWQWSMHGLCVFTLIVCPSGISWVAFSLRWRGSAWRILHSLCVYSCLQVIRSPLGQQQNSVLYNMISWSAYTVNHNNVIVIVVHAINNILILYIPAVLFYKSVCACKGVPLSCLIHVSLLILWICQSQWWKKLLWLWSSLSRYLFCGGLFAHA